LLPDPVLDLSAEIIVVGAGIAGTTAAAVLNRQGRRVILLDTRATCPPVFKAEKVERDALRLIRELDLFTPLLPYAGHIAEVCVAYDGHIFKRQQREQIGISYSDLVNTLRTHLSPEIQNKLGRVEQITRNGDTTSVHLESGEKLTARLVVLACGLNSQLLASLGLQRRIIRKEQSVVAGFNIIPSGSDPFNFDSVTFYPTDPSFKIDYLTLFKIRDTMRANLFAYHSIHDPWMREFQHNPKFLLDQAFPKLTRVIGNYEVVGKVVSNRVDLYSTEGEKPDGVVLIGDAFQNACPATGYGFVKVFTDVNALAECAPAWFSTPGMSAEKLKTFYEHPRKQAEDATALHRASVDRLAATSSAPRWRLRRAVLHVRRHLTHTKPQPTRSQSPNVPRGSEPASEPASKPKKWEHTEEHNSQPVA
jgi:2-polyprenyl-6-methoxyphenol hydroxylase-like FAD-dependent oxidoreductase